MKPEIKFTSDFKKEYFELNGVNGDLYKDYKFQGYLENTIPKDKLARILDIGCGFGQMLSLLKIKGYTDIKGIDICSQSNDYCKEHGLDVTTIKNIESFCTSSTKKYDFIIMAHILEHIKKDKMIETIKYIRQYLLEDGGELCIMVPNGQSNVGAYWLFEDFTHEFLFTARSLSYVLNAAGFKEIKFLDIDATEYLPLYKKIIRKIFLKLYSINQRFWNKMTSTTFHKQSKIIYGFEIRVLVKKMKTKNINL